METVEIICRCKDCEDYEPKYDGYKKLTFGYCYYWDYEQGSSPNHVDEDDFCSNCRIKEKR